MEMDYRRIEKSLIDNFLNLKRKLQQPCLDQRYAGTHIDSRINSHVFDVMAWGAYIGRSNDKHFSLF